YGVVAVSLFGTRSALATSAPALAGAPDPTATPPPPAPDPNGVVFDVRSERTLVTVGPDQPATVPYTDGYILVVARFPGPVNLQDLSVRVLPESSWDLDNKNLFPGNRVGVTLFRGSASPIVVEFTQAGRAPQRLLLQTRSVACTPGATPTPYVGPLTPNTTHVISSWDGRGLQ